MTTKYIRDITELANEGNIRVDADKIEYIAYIYDMDKAFVRSEVRDLIIKRLRRANKAVYLLTRRLEELSNATD